MFEKWSFFVVVVATIWLIHILLLSMMFVWSINGGFNIGGFMSNLLQYFL